MSYKVLVLALAMLLTGVVSAQDVITLKSGDEINGKVTKVTSTEIEYKLATNPDGPVYTKPLAEIFMVKYENGHKDVFNKPAAQTEQQGLPTNSMQPSSYTLERSRGRIVPTEGELTDDQLEYLLGREQYKQYKEMNEQYVSQTNGAVCMIGFAILGPVMLWAAPLADSQTLRNMYTGAGIAFTVAGNILAPVCFISRGILAGKISRMAEGYNAQNGSLSMNLSAGFTMMPTAQGSVAPGLGVALRF